MTRFGRLSRCLAAVMALGACSTEGEELNRATFAFNEALRENVINPVHDAYREITPEPVQEGVSNFFSNLREPVTVVSSTLQGDAVNALNATGRFITNSTIGLAGTRDVAGEGGLTSRPETLAQAVCAWGVPAGPYIVLPILGPSTLTDAGATVGQAAATKGVAGPGIDQHVSAYQAADGTVAYFDIRDSVDAINEGRIDCYTAQKAAYLQVRERDCKNGEPELEAVAWNDFEPSKS